MNKWVAENYRRDLQGAKRGQLAGKTGSLGANSIGLLKCNGLEIMAADAFPIQK
jgi:hypothetical protein